MATIARTRAMMETTTATTWRPARKWGSFAVFRAPDVHRLSLHRPQPTTPRQMTRAMAPITTRRRATTCAARVRHTDFSSRHRLWRFFIWASFRGPNGRPDGLCTWPSCPLVADAPPRRRGGCRESAVVHRSPPAQAPAYYYYTATDDSTYGYDDSTYAYGSDDAYGHAQCTKSNIVAARPRHGSITASTPSAQRQSMAWRPGLPPLDSACAPASRRGRTW